MTCLFDTTLLVAGSIEDHAHHALALPWLTRAKAGEIKLTLSAHSLAETYAILTGIPKPLRVQPSAARIYVDAVAGAGSVVALSADEYRSIVDRCAALDLRGGVVYDFVILSAAEKAKVDRIVTFNTRHFRRLCPDRPDWIVEPT